MLAVPLPVAERAPPSPWAAVLPARKVQLICADAGGALALLLSAIFGMNKLTSLCVARFSKVPVIAPPALLVTIPIVMPFTVGVHLGLASLACQNSRKCGTGSESNLAALAHFCQTASCQAEACDYDLNGLDPSSRCLRA